MFDLVYNFITENAFSILMIEKTTTRTTKRHSKYVQSNSIGKTHFSQLDRISSEKFDNINTADIFSSIKNKNCLQNSKIQAWRV